MRTFVYKRTHCGDPGEDGVFGVNDCMGRHRDREFEAVIGIGGISPDRKHKDIAERLTWVGIGASRFGGSSKHRGSLVKFDQFLLLDRYGPLVQELAPKLHRYMLVDQSVRGVLSDSLSLELNEEIHGIFRWAAENYKLEPSRPRRNYELPDDLGDCGCGKCD